MALVAPSVPVDPTMFEPQVEDGAQLFEPNTNPVVVPRNVQEVAAQAAAVDESQLEMPFTTRLADKQRIIEQHGISPVVQDVALQERQDHEDALRKVADAAAKQGDAPGLESAARMIADAKTKLVPTDVEGHKAMAQRSLEAQGLQWTADRYKSLEKFDEVVKDNAEAVSLRNIVAQESAKQDVSLWDTATNFFTQLLPFAHDYRVNRAISDVTGIDHYFDTEASVNDFRQFFRGLGLDERREVIRKLAEQQVGLIGDNRAGSVELLRKLAEMTKEDANIDILFNSLAVTDVAALTRGLFNLVRRGTPLKALHEVAGNEAAAKLATADLVNGTKVGGLNDAELMGRILSVGANPFEKDPAALQGMSAAAQAELRTAWNDLLSRTKNRLLSSGLTPEEVKQGLTDIRAQYSAETNRAIHSVIFGEGDEVGQDMTVFWQGSDGRAFGSKEAAEAWAKAEGKVAYEVVPRNAASAVESFKATAPDGMSHGFDPRRTYDDSLEGILKDTDSNVLKSMKGSPRINTFFDQMASMSDGDPMSLSLVDQYKEAAQRGHSAISAERVLTTIARQSTDDDIRFLAQHLLDTKAKKGIAWDKVSVELHYDISGAYGTYNVVNDKVKVALQSATDPTTLLHELIHAHNAQVITLVAGKPKMAAMALTKDQIEAAKIVIALHKKAKAWWEKATYKEREKYGGLVSDLGDIYNNNKLKFSFDHPAEFIAHGLTSVKARDVLKKLKLADIGYEGEGTVFSKLWDAFKGLLGLRANDTVLAKLVEAHDRLAQSITPSARMAITNMHNTGILAPREINTMMRAGAKMEFASKKPASMVKALEKEIRVEEKKLTKVSDAEREQVVERIKQLREAAESLKKPAAPAAPTEEWLVKERRKDPIAFANIGKFSEDDIRSMPWIAVDPKHAASELAVEERVIGVHAESKTRRDFTSFLTPYFDKLNGAGKARVKAVLEEGDAFSNGGEFGKEFTYTELVAKGLSEAEAQAYFATRQVRMVSYHLRNGEMVRALRADGYKEVEFLGTGMKLPGRVLEQEQAGQALGKVVYDTLDNKPYLVDSKTLEESYRAGKKIVQLKQPVELGGKRYMHVLVDDTTAKARDIHAALHYRPGEFSRIYSDQYFITMKKVQEVDGSMQDVVETVRTAASTREAQEYVEAHRKALKLLLDQAAGKVPGNLKQELEKLVGHYTDVDELISQFDKGEFGGFVDMDFHYTRNKEEFLNGSISESLTNGRLFTSKRSGKLLSVDRDRRNTLDVFESMEAEITNISRVANISMWKESMIRRWMNTFGHMLPARTGNDVADFFAAAGAKFTRGTQDAQFAERTHAYIMRQLGVKTQEMKMWEGVTRTLTEKLLQGNERAEALGAKIRTMSWLGFIRNVNFNLNLGMFNPAQLLVQANGATTALILSPLHGAKAAMTFPLLRVALMSDNPDVWAKLAKVEKFKNLGLSNEGEFVELVKAVRKSGIIDNVRSTALWNLEDGALNVFGGYPQRLARSNTAFFNRGEEFSRLVSFDVARREWMAKNPGQAWNSDVALKSIVVRMDDLTQNMTKANLARFQEGVLSIPLQFAQYNIKLAANVMTAFASGGKGRGFSRMEAAQLLLGHIVLYGAAGNGLVWAVEEVLGNTAKDKLSVDQKELLSQGLVSWTLDQVHQHLAGEHTHVALGSRLGSFDYYQRLAEAAFTDKTSVYSALLGPTVSSAKRLGSIGEVVGLWHKDPDLTGRDVVEGLATMTMEQVASLRNVSKAYLYMQHQGKMLDRQGVATGQLNSSELLWQALGFQPTVAVDVDNLIKSKHDHALAIDDISKLILRTQKDITTSLLKGDVQRADEQKKLLQALWPDNAGDLMEVQRRIKDRLFPYDNEFQKLLGEYMWKGQTYNKPVIVTEQPKAK